MRTVVALVWALLISNGCLAAEKCTYDQGNQVQVLKNVARRHPGGSLDEGGRRIAWSLAAGGLLTYEYGGCYDLGSVVTRLDRLPEARDESQVLAIAVELASQYWENPDREELIRGLNELRFKKEEMNGKTFFHVPREDYSVFSVEHEYSSGMDRIVIVWSRNF